MYGKSRGDRRRRASADAPGADDPDDNVVEAALTPLRRLIGADSDALFVEALNRRTRTVQRPRVRPYRDHPDAAAGARQGAPTPALVNALGERARAHHRRAVRDIARHAAGAHRSARAARVPGAGLDAHCPSSRHRSARARAAAASHAVDGPGRGNRRAAAQKSAFPPEAVEALDRWSEPFSRWSGGRFEIRFTVEAPLARTRFLAAVRLGLLQQPTFHRIVPNFIIQGGSPGANEYCGDCPFMRDEVGLGMHERGTDRHLDPWTRHRRCTDLHQPGGLPPLDLDYTVFARVCVARG